MVLIAPSLLSADFKVLKEEITMIEQSGADWLHFDVMDGRFVPNISFGLPVLEAIRPITTVPIDCHLMVEEPSKQIPLFAQAGADYISIHLEATSHIDRDLSLIKEYGSKTGVVINPGTAVELLKPILHRVDMVLVMTVNPGFGGQSFISEVSDKVDWLKKERETNGYDYLIEVDGGINVQTIQSVSNADVFVAGSAIFNAADRSREITLLREKAEK